VQTLKPGDRVFTWKTATGAYAQHTIADEINTFAIGETLPFKQGAGIGAPYMTAYRALVLKAGLKVKATHKTVN